MTTRREFLSAMGAGLAVSAMPNLAFAQEKTVRLAMPPLLDATRTGEFRLTAAAGRVNFLGRGETGTWGFNQPYLGPTVRVPPKGEVAAKIENTLREEISVHWHGLVIPGDVDGGPHQPVKPGGTWAPVLPIDQAPATVWYHSHMHSKTAEQVYNGLAGVMQITDGQDDARGLPSAYGVDDLMLVLQDRRFDRKGRMVYNPNMHDGMMGFTGNVMLVNGQVNPVAAVPKGIVRLRLLNGSNARIYTLSLQDWRSFHLVATDSGFLDQPVAMKALTLSPGERAEVLVDFSSGGETALVSGPILGADATEGGLLRRNGTRDERMNILPFAIDSDLPVRIGRLPGGLGGSVPDMSPNGAVTRNISLDIGAAGMFRRASDRFSINGRPFDMDRLNFTVARGTTERWIVSAERMVHPFHVHGVSFQVLGENGGPVGPQNRGWKDTVLVNGQVELLIRFDQPASEALPYMFHCHILEHEDGGMMGQFAVV